MGRERLGALQQGIVSGHPFAGSEIVGVPQKSEALKLSFCPLLELLGKCLPSLEIGRSVARAVYRNFLGSLWLNISSSFRACPELSPLSPCFRVAPLVAALASLPQPHHCVLVYTTAAFAAEIDPTLAPFS